MNKTVAVRVLLGLLALVLVGGLMFSFVPALSGLRGSAQSQPAIKVNGVGISAQTLQDVRSRSQLLSAVTTGPLGDDFKTLLIDSQVKQTLQQQAAADQKIDRATVNAEVDKTRQANNLTSSKAWADALRNVGFTDASYREYVRSSLAVQAKAKAIQAAAPKPTDAQMQLYYQLNPQQSDARIVGREIVVASKAKADALLAQAKGGADFAALATANSLQFKERGGALGPIENGAPRPVAAVALPTEVSTAVFAKPAPGLSPVIASGGQYYIVKTEKYLPPAPKPFAEVKQTVNDTVSGALKNAAVEQWLDSLNRGAKVESLSKDWAYNNPTVAVVNGQNIPYAEAVALVASNQQFGQLIQSTPPDQAAGLVNQFLKPGVVQQLIQQYAAPIIVKSQNLPLVGSRAELLAGLNAYGARDVKVSSADIQAYYQANQKQFQTPAKGTVSEAVFSDKAQAEAFRQSFKSGDFTALASQAGGTVSERGPVTEGDKKLNDALDKAVFGAAPLQAAGEGSLSAVVENAGRYSLGYVTDLVKGGVRPLSEVTSTISDQLLTQKKQAASSAYIAAQMKGIKTQDLLSQVLAAQTKRLAAEQPAAKPNAQPNAQTPNSTAPSTPSGTPAAK